jgi:hypothetical protein
MILGVVIPGDLVEVSYHKPGTTGYTNYKGKVVDMPVYSTGPHIRIEREDGSFRQFSLLRSVFVTPLAISS